MFTQASGSTVPATHDSCPNIYESLLNKFVGVAPQITLVHPTQTG